MTVIAQSFWIVGAVLLLTVAAQGVLASLTLLRRYAFEQGQLQRARELLDLRVREASARLEKETQKSLAWGGWRKFQVAWKRYENGRKDICSFYLIPHDGKPIPSFEPGQFLTFRLDVPGQTKPVVRCYSLSDAPNPDRYRVSIRRLPAPPDSQHPPGLSSNHFHANINEGDILDVKAPAGNFHLDVNQTRPVVLIGGGVGITPVLSMLNAIVASRTARETWFFLGVRDRDDHPMKEHLETIARENPNVHLHVVYSHPREGIDQPGVDYHHSGFLGAALFRKLLPSNNYQWYYCGPPPMMDVLERDLKAWGVPDEHVHYEKFGPGPRKTHPAAAPDSAGIAVVFSRSKRTLNWSAAAGTLLELARDNGITIESGCEQGNCGTCQTALRSGAVVYVDTPSFDCEQGTCLPCVCHPQGPLEIDA
jgi:ferredoxin-NADP reductase